MRILVYRLSLNSECEEATYFISPTMQVIVPKKVTYKLLYFLGVTGSTAVKCGRRQMSGIMVEIGSHTKKCHTSVMRSKPCVN